MAKSIVAAVVDSGGGVRVVVTERWRLRNHVGPGERAFVVPHLRVREPVPWGEIPSVIAAAERHLKGICNDAGIPNKS